MSHPSRRRRTTLLALALLPASLVTATTSASAAPAAAPKPEFTRVNVDTGIQGASFTVVGEIFDGEFLSVAADGSTAYGVYSGSFTINADGTVSYSVNVIWTGGTGRLEGLVGYATVEALATGTAPGSTYEYVTDGFWLLP